MQKIKEILTEREYKNYIRFSKYKFQPEHHTEVDEQQLKEVQQLNGVYGIDFEINGMLVVKCITKDGDKFVKTFPFDLEFQIENK